APTASSPRGFAGAEFYWRFSDGTTTRHSARKTPARALINPTTARPVDLIGELHASCRGVPGGARRRRGSAAYRRDGRAFCAEYHHWFARGGGVAKGVSRHLPRRAYYDLEPGLLCCEVYRSRRGFGVVSS